MAAPRFVVRIVCWLASVTLSLGVGYAIGRNSASREPGIARAASVTKRASYSDSIHTGISNEGSVETRRASVDDEVRRWQQRARDPRTPRSEKELAADLESLATYDHDAAMALALAEPNLRFREILQHAVLRGWASVASEAALAFAMRLTEADNRPAIEAVFGGAAHDPTSLLRAARRLTDDGSLLASEFGVMAVKALAEAGQFEAAAQFAAGGSTSGRTDRLNEAFTRWAEHQPEAALRAARELQDATLRHDAWQGVVNGWAQSNPAALADYALQLPQGPDRTLAFGQALPNWFTRDPVAASAWLSDRSADATLDVGFSAVATMPSLMAQRPEVAIDWAKAITATDVRASALQAIGEQWSRNAPTSFQQWLAQNPQLSAADRQALLDGAASLSTGG